MSIYLYIFIIFAIGVQSCTYANPFYGKTYREIRYLTKKYPDFAEKLNQIVGAQNASKNIYLLPSNSKYDEEELQFIDQIPAISSKLKSFNPTSPNLNCHQKINPEGYGERKALTRNVEFIASDRIESGLNDVDIENSLALSDSTYESLKTFGECSKKYLTDDLKKNRQEELTSLYKKLNDPATSSWEKSRLRKEFNSILYPPKNSNITIDRLNKYRKTLDISDLPAWLRGKKHSYIDRIVGADKNIEKYIASEEYGFASDIIRLREPLTGNKINFSHVIDGESLLQRIVNSEDDNSKILLARLTGITNDFQVCLTGKNNFLGLEDYNYFKLLNDQQSIFDIARSDETKFSILERVFRSKNKQIDFEERSLVGNSPKSDLEDINIRIVNTLKTEELLKGPGLGLGSLSFEEVETSVGKLKLHTINIRPEDGSYRNYYSEMISELNDSEVYNYTAKKLIDSALTIKSLDRTIEIIAEREAKIKTDALKKKYDEQLAKAKAEAAVTRSGNFFKCEGGCLNLKCNFAKFDYWVSRTARRRCRNRCAQQCTESAKKVKKVLKLANYALNPYGALAGEYIGYCKKPENAEKDRCNVYCEVTFTDSSSDTSRAYQDMDATEASCKLLNKDGQTISLNFEELNNYYKNDFLQRTEGVNLRMVNRASELALNFGESEEEIFESQTDFIKFYEEQMKELYDDIGKVREGKTDGYPDGYFDYLDELEKPLGEVDLTLLFPIGAMIKGLGAGTKLSLIGLKSLYKKIPKNIRFNPEYLKTQLKLFSSYLADDTGSILNGISKYDFEKSALVIREVSKEVLESSKFFIENVYRSRHDTMIDSVVYHYAKHGGGRSVTKYYKDALSYLQKNRHLAKNIILKDGTRGYRINTVKVLSNGKTKKVTGIYTSSGKVVSYAD